MTTRLVSGVFGHVGELIKEGILNPGESQSKTKERSAASTSEMFDLVGVFASKTARTPEEAEEMQRKLREAKEKAERGDVEERESDTLSDEASSELDIENRIECVVEISEKITQTEDHYFETEAEICRLRERVRELELRDIIECPACFDNAAKYVASPCGHLNIDAHFALTKK